MAAQEVRRVGGAHRVVDEELLARRDVAQGDQGVAGPAEVRVAGVVDRPLLVDRRLGSEHLGARRDRRRREQAPAGDGRGADLHVGHAPIQPPSIQPQSSRATSGSRERANRPTTRAVTAGSTTTRPSTISHGMSRNGPVGGPPSRPLLDVSGQVTAMPGMNPTAAPEQRPDQADHDGVRRRDPAPGARRGAHGGERREVGPRVGEGQEGRGQGAAEHQDPAQGEQDDLRDHRLVVGLVAALDVHRRGLGDRGQGLVGVLLLLLGHVPGHGQRDGGRLGAQLLGRGGGDDGGRTGPGSVSVTNAAGSFASRVPVSSPVSGS